MTITFDSLLPCIQTLDEPQKHSGGSDTEHSVVRTVGPGVSRTGLESWYHHSLANNSMFHFLHQLQITIRHTSFKGLER